MASDQPTPVYSDTGPFAIVPEWLLVADVSDRAVRLYAVLARYADQAGECWPMRRTLADRLGCSVDSVDRAVRELKKAGAVRVEPRRTAGGDQTSNTYTVVRLPRGAPAAEPRPPLRADAAQNESHELEPGNDSRGDPRTSPDERATVVADAEGTPSQRADRLTRHWWEASNPRPLVPFIAAKKIVEKALKAGWSDERVARALPHSTPLSAWRLESTLKRHQQADDARAHAPARDGPRPDSEPDLSAEDPAAFQRRADAWEASRRAAGDAP
jgi:hypothetical protein